MLSATAKTSTTKKADPAIVISLYQAVTTLARQPVFYTRFAVPDTTDGRYDLFCLMLSLYLFRIQQNEPETAQALFDLAFKDQERALREAGVGDLGVPKHMKKMIGAFYGRAAAYYEALDQQDTASLAAAMTKNLYSGVLDAPSGSIAEWTRIAWQYLSGTDLQEFMADPTQLLQLVPPTEESA